MDRFMVGIGLTKESGGPIPVARMTLCECGHRGIEHYDSYGFCMVEGECECKEFRPSGPEIHVQVGEPQIRAEAELERMRIQLAMDLAPHQGHDGIAAARDDSCLRCNAERALDRVFEKAYPG